MVRCCCPCNFTTVIGCILTIEILHALRFANMWVWCAIVVFPAVVYAMFGERTKATPVADKVVLVTGASSGLGKAIAIEAAKRGAKKVILVARSAGKLQETAAECAACDSGCEAHVETCDLTDKEDMKRLAKKVTDEHGALDVLVNNAGAGRWLHIEETTPEEALDMFQVPVQAAITLTALLVPAMAKAKTGHVLNVTSAAGMVAFRGAVGYSTARWAMRGFSKNLYWDVKQLGIGVTLLCPAEIEGTNYFVTAGEDSHNKIPILFWAVGKLGLNYTTGGTAWAAWNAVENGWSVALTPFFVTHLFGLLNQIVPFFVEAIANVGPRGIRKVPGVPQMPGMESLA